MAYQGNQSSGGQAPQNRPQLPSIHNLNTSYYPGFPPMQQPSGGYSEHPSGRQAAPFSSLPNMASSAEGYGRPTAPGSSWSDGPAQSPMGQTPPETGQPSPAATSGSGGQPGTSQPAKGASGGSEFVKKLFK